MRDYNEVIMTLITRSRDALMSNMGTANKIRLLPEMIRIDKMYKILWCQRKIMKT